MNRWQRLFEGIKTEIKVFIFFSALLTAFRIVFLAVFQSQLASVTMENILTSLWLGFRLSLKTVGSLCLLGFLGGTLVHTFVPKWPSLRIKQVIYSIATVLLTFLFLGRIPFYKIFNSSYNAMLINGKNDDIGAIVNTAINEYNALMYIIGAIVLSAALCWFLVRFLGWGAKKYSDYADDLRNGDDADDLKNIDSADNQRLCTTWYPKTKKTQWMTGIGLTIVIGVLGLFFRFGGAFSYTNSINWESAARLSSNLLNENILDDVQALYRVKSIAKRTAELEVINLTPQELNEKITAVGGKFNGTNFDGSFTRTITTQRLAEQPQSINLVLGESYGLWPFLAEYNEPGAYLVEQGRKYAASHQAMSTQLALAQGTGTMPAINGLLTGMPDTGLYPNYEGESFKEPYGLGIGPVMKKLGYKTVFWYGGFSTWQNVKNFVLSQGFDEFHDASEMPSEDGNAWGVGDKDLFKAISAYHLPDSIEENDKQLNEMGHIWYADHVMGDFIAREETADPSALFIITGDHSERFNFAREVGPNVASTIPIIFYGHGIHKDWLAPNAFGMSIQIIPTLAELVGRPGQTYEAMVPSLFTQEEFVFNHRLYLDKSGKVLEQSASMPQSYGDMIKNMRELAAWRIKHGNNIK
ncbi:LTA synthase family protein [Veillonella parvula]|uniref:LTA synthase family protein n=1 Tax=Veillonella parvula TaxID=29466 RepID=UPI002901E556|nr:LTA synthase family protein [Veillonella parvula]MDU3191578.1 LTA synthase family protein [Veillonella parvula]